MSGWHIAQLNVGRILAPTDSPQLTEFMAALDEINARAEATPGFIWRLQSDSGNATDIRVSEDPNFLINMSVWATIEPLFEFVLSLRAHRRHGAASPVVREANRGVPGPVVGSRRTGSERARSAGSSRSPAPARTDAAGIHVQSALPAARGAGQPAGHETRTVLRRLALIYSPTLRTARERALPLIMRSYAVWAFSRGQPGDHESVTAGW